MLFVNLILKIYKRTLLKRHDPDGSVFYYSPEDFEGLSSVPFEFPGERGQLLQGYFYRKNVTRPSRLVIFEHGMGCGHRAYMREISVLCERGYEVFAYDHTGTLESEGEHIGGFTQSLCDLNSAITALKDSGRLGERDIAVIGHSWGGFSTMNIGAFHPEITHLVALAGFISPRKIIGDMLGKMRGVADKAFSAEVERFGGYAYANAAVSLLETRARALIVHSKDDPTVPFSHLTELKSMLRGKVGVEFLELDGKRHNPNFTEDAVRYKDEFFSELTRLKKKKRLVNESERLEFAARWDWERMTAQDMEFWQRVFGFIEED